MIKSKTYIGSFVNLFTIFMFYFCKNFLTKGLTTINSLIYKTLLNNGIGYFDL